MPTPLYDLAVVSIRWGRPMIYKEHIQMGAIWDLRKRTHTAFTAYPLFGDPEEDEFYIERDNRLIVFPWNIRDAYIFVYKRDGIKNEALKIAQKVGLDDVSISVYVGNGTTSNCSKYISPKELMRKEKDIHITYCTYFSDSLSTANAQKKFERMLKEYDSQNMNLERIALYIYYNKDAFESERNGITPEGEKYMYMFRLGSSKEELSIGEDIE